MSSSVAQLYTDGLYTKYRFLGTWLPNAGVRLGDIGQLNRHLWAREGSLPPDSWDGRVRQGAKSPLLEWQNTDKYKIETKAAGQADPSFTGLATVDGGIAYTFDKGNAIIFHAEDLTETEVADTAPIRRWMLNEHRAGRLEPDTVAVTKVYRAKSLLVLITQSDGARVEMKTSAAIAAGSRAMARLSGDLDIVRTTGMFLQIIVHDATPLFGGIRLRKRPWSAASARDLLLSSERGVEEPPPLDDDDPFEVIGISE
jgi:hypothetical protein